jgi:hypothetical protein
LSRIRRKQRFTPGRESATQHLAAIFDFARRLGEIERRERVRVDAPTAADPWPHPHCWTPGQAIVTLLEEAAANERDRRELVRALGTIWDRARAYIAAIGDDRRAKGLAVPLCWLPGDSTEEE